MSTALVRYDAARKALQAAVSVDEIKDVRDKAQAMAAYARQAKDTELVAWATEIKVRAERRAGEMLRDMARKGERAHQSHGASSRMMRPDVPPTLATIGINKSQSSRWQKLAEIPEKVFEKRVTEQREAAGEVLTTRLLREQKEQRREERRETNREKVRETPSIDATTGGARFASILIDPPWDWGDEGDVDQLGRARTDYATMSIEQIRALPLGDLSDVDCHLYLWITNRSLPKGFSLIESWGFRYVTCITWCKPSIGMGNYFRGSTEHLLFAVRGSQMLKRKDVGTWFAAPRGKGHSAKPGQVYDLVESCSPGPHLEMFSRSGRQGWTHWGADAKNAP